MAKVRPDWFCICGTRHDDCNLHRAMIGREYAWGFVTDEQLRAECERRKLISGDFAIVDLVRATNEGLRAECERRGMAWSQYDGRKLAETLEAELRQANREISSEREVLQSFRDGVHKALRDIGCTEGEDTVSFLLGLKKRAEAAEKDLADLKSMHVIRVESGGGELVDLGSVHDCGRLELLVTRRDNERLMVGGRTALEALEQIATDGDRYEIQAFGPNDPKPIRRDSAIVSGVTFRAKEPVNNPLAAMDDHERHAKAHAEAFGDYYLATLAEQLDSSPEGPYAPCSLYAALERQRKADVERGLGIRTLTLPSGRPVSEVIDLATLADLLADDVD